MITTFFTLFTVQKMSTQSLSSLQEENQQYHFKLRLEFFQFEFRPWASKDLSKHCARKCQTSFSIEHLNLAS